MFCQRSLVLAAVLLITLACAIPTDGVWAGTQDGSAIALHAKTHTTKATTACTTWAPALPCSDYVTAWPIGVAADVYLTVVRGQLEPGIAGLSCGIDYTAAPGAGVDVSGYTLCADLEFTNAGANGEWPAAGGGNRITWDRLDNCQRTLMGNDGVHAVACAFYVYAYGEDQFRVIPNANLQSGPEIKVADCGSAESAVTTAASGTVFFSAAASGGCNPCADACDEGSACFVTPKYLGFGTVAPGASLDKAFTVSNQGTYATSGTIAETEPSPDFDVISGGGFYTLLPGQAREVIVRFAPTTTSIVSCSIVTGSLCAGVFCSGNEGAQCDVSPASLAFGEVALGEYMDFSFTIMSTGSAPIHIDPQSPCAEFTILSGSGAGDLAPGQSRTVAVRFTPTSVGSRSCSISTGTLCAAVPCAGTGTARCNVYPTSLSFVSVVIGSMSEKSFTITNQQANHSLAINVSMNCPPFSITAGAGPGSLAPGQSRTVTVRFAPTEAGSFQCAVLTGSSTCANVQCTGTAIPYCSVDPAALDFGTIAVGSFSNASFLIWAGGRDQQCNVSLTGDEFFVLSGGGSFSLRAHTGHWVTVRCQPISAGPKTCVVETGSTDCGQVTGTATAVASSEHQDRAVIALHAKSHTSKSVTVCTPAQQGGPAPTNIPCTSYVTRARTGQNYDVYLMVARVDVVAGISEAAMGIDYNGGAGAGVDVFSWTSCAGTEVSFDWPAAGQGLAVSWSRPDDCQRFEIPGHTSEGVAAAVGAFYVYAYGPDALTVTPRQDLPSRDLYVTDCIGVRTSLPPERGGAVVFSPSGDAFGCNPCIENCGPPTAVSILAFTATRVAEGAELRWRATGIEADHAGFEIHRETATGERVTLDGPIAADDEGYTFIDNDPPSIETRYWLAERSRAGDVTWFGPAILAPGEPNGIGFRVLSVGPSPFTSVSRFAFRTGQDGPVIVRVLDALGREVARPHDGALPAGKHDVTWDGRTANGQTAPAGVYLYRIETPHGVASGKIVLIRGR